MLAIYFTGSGVYPDLSSFTGSGVIQISVACIKWSAPSQDHIIWYQSFGSWYRFCFHFHWLSISFIFVYCSSSICRCYSVRISFVFWFFFVFKKYIDLILLLLTWLIQVILSSRSLMIWLEYNFIWFLKFIIVHLTYEFVKIDWFDDFVIKWCSSDL